MGFRFRSAIATASGFRTGDTVTALTTNEQFVVTGIRRVRNPKTGHTRAVLDVRRGGLELTQVQLPLFPTTDTVELGG